MGKMIYNAFHYVMNFNFKIMSNIYQKYINLIDSVMFFLNVYNTIIGNTFEFEGSLL